MNAHLHGAPQIVFNASRCHDLFHAFILHLTLSIAHDAPEVPLWDLLPSRIDRFHLRHRQIQLMGTTPNYLALLRTMEWSL